VLAGRVSLAALPLDSRVWTILSLGKSLTQAHTLFRAAEKVQHHHHRYGESPIPLA